MRDTQTGSAAARAATGQTGAMSSDRAVLTSLATALDDLTDRLAAVASAHVGGPDEHVATDLFEVERSLRGASRRLERALRGLAGS